MRTAANELVVRFHLHVFGSAFLVMAQTARVSLALKRRNLMKSKLVRAVGNDINRDIYI